MLLIPAIDLKDGKCVRLKQGELDCSTKFADDPVEPALRWLANGAKRLHLVDLNGAFAGSPKNLVAIKEIVAAVNGGIPIQLGGGIRNMATIENMLKLGINDIILGTAAMNNPSFLKEACSEFGGHIIAGVDAKNGKVAVDGWKNVSSIEALDLVKRFADLGVQSVIYTDISRDGMLQGINIDATAKLARESNVRVIASGGLASLDDIRALVSHASDGIVGVICGTAIYNGTLDFIEAQAFADNLLRSDKK